MERWRGGWTGTVLECRHPVSLCAKSGHCHCYQCTKVMFCTSSIYLSLLPPAWKTSPHCQLLAVYNQFVLHSERFTYRLEASGRRAPPMRRRTVCINSVNMKEFRETLHTSDAPLGLRATAVGTLCGYKYSDYLLSQRSKCIWNVKRHLFGIDRIRLRRLFLRKELVFFL